MITVYCEWCGKRFEKFPSRAKRTKRHFCCYEHHGLWKRGKESYTRTPEHRASMSKTIKSNKRLMQFQRDRIRKYNLETKKGRTWEELYGSERAEQLRQHYRQRMSGKQNPNYGNSVLGGENNPNWKGGVSKEPYTFDFDAQLKTKIRKRDGNKCQLCDLTNREHRKQYSNDNLSIHHIDYDKTNSNHQNLITLCKTCHSVSNHNRAYHQQLFTEYIERKDKHQ